MCLSLRYASIHALPPYVSCALFHLSFFIFSTLQINNLYKHKPKSEKRKITINGKSLPLYKSATMTPEDKMECWIMCDDSVAYSSVTASEYLLFFFLQGGGRLPNDKLKQQKRTDHWHYNTDSLHYN